jgi:uncharacterized protein YjbI with pentapeptide repeats/beta-lactamase regulating signal transducer with metallopeptidase domain
VSELHQGFVTVASALAAITLNALWQDALLVLCVWLLLRAWPRINAATRYTVWGATLIAAIVVPVATTLAFFAPPSTVAAPVLTTAHERVRHVAAPRTNVPVRSAQVPIAAPEAPRLPERLRVTLPLPVSFSIFGLWALLAAYALARLALGLRRLEQLKRDALPLPVEYRDAMPQWLRANKGARDVRLCVSDDTDVPVAVGLFDAMILIPRSLLARLSEPEVDQICLHELAHLRRADDWTNGAQRVIAALLGWNPAAQFIGQQLDLEREVACDDWVLSYIGKVRPYALCLTKMAEGASWPRQPIPAPGVFATRKHISLRIERLLGAGRNVATNLALGPAAAAVAVVGAIALVIAVVAPSVAAPCIGSVPVAATASQSSHAAMRTIAPPSPLIRTAAAGSLPATRNVATSIDVTVPATRVNVPATHVDVPATHVDVPATHVTVPATNLTVPGAHVSIPATHIEIPSVNAASISQEVSRSVAAAVRAIPSTVVAQYGPTGDSRSCNGCDFKGVNWAGRDMRGLRYIGVDLSRANLAGTNFAEGNFNGVDFTGANLNNASFRNARLTGCDFSEADLSGVDFTGARISGCQFTGARLASSQLRDVLNSWGCDFSHANLSGLNLSNVRASGDDFSEADLRGVNFAGAQLVGVDFSGARLDRANLAGATLNGCDLSDVDLTHVDLSRTKMIGMDFSDDRTPHP